MKNIKSQKGFYIFISILVAITFWLYVDHTGSGEREIRLYNVPVTFVGENDELAERGLMIVSGQDTEIDLRLQGRLQVISKINKNNIKIQVDVGNIFSTGTHTLNYKVVYPDSVSQNSVSLVSASLYAVTVDIGELYSKPVDVHVDIEGSVADGYMLHECMLTPEKLIVSGTQQEVESIDHALVKVELKNATTSYSEYLSYTLIDQDGKVVNKSRLTFSEEKVRVEVPVVILKEVPLKIEFADGGGTTGADVDCTITPPSITLSGEESTLNKINSITLGEIDLSQMMGNENLEMEIPIPGGCSNESGTDTAKVKIRFDDLATESFECSNIKFSNVPDGYTPVAITQTVDVTLRGEQSILSRIQTDDICVVVDLSDKTPASGTYTEKAKVFVYETDEVGAIGTYQIGYRLEKS